MDRQDSAVHRIYRGEEIWTAVRIQQVNGVFRRLQLCMNYINLKCKIAENCT